MDKQIGGVQASAVLGVFSAENNIAIRNETANSRAVASRAGERVQVSAKKELSLKIGLLLSLLLLAAPAAAQTASGRDSLEQSTGSEKAAGNRVRIPSRPSKPLFEGKQG